MMSDYNIHKLWLGCISEPSTTTTLLIVYILIAAVHCYLLYVHYMYYMYYIHSYTPYSCHQEQSMMFLQSQPQHQK